MTAQFEKHPFLLPSTDVAALLKTDVDNGLTSTQVAQLQNEYPPNELDIQGSISWHSILAKQLFNAMIMGKCRSTFLLILADWNTELTVVIYSPCFCNHCLLRYQRLGRGRCTCCGHRPQCIYWFRARVKGRKENGLSPSVELPVCKRHS